MNLYDASVTGILNMNSAIRDEHLKRNYGKYSQYNEVLSPAIGEVYNINYNRPLVSITNGQSLLEYTHNNKEPYGSSIDQKYFFNNREKEVYSVEEVTPDQIKSWAGQYADYITYLDEVLGEDVYSRHVKYINDFLSGNYIENALRQTEVGVVRNINVPIARQGIITTNLNNLKAIDTPLGTITNSMYSAILYNAAIFNSDRHSEKKYITPSLINQYGNNLANVAELGDMLRVGVKDYRLKEDLGADANIVDDYKSGQIFDLNTYWLDQNIEEAKRYQSEKNKGFNGYSIGGDGYISAMGKVKNSRNSNIFSSEYKHNTDKTYPIYNENDNKVNGYLNIDDGEDEDRINDNIDIDTLNINHDDAAWEDYKSITYTEESKSSILSKTAKLFNEHKINTLIGRFHTSQEVSNKSEFIDTAKSKFGNSHGRNLLTKKAQEQNLPDNYNGYSNPYCRTWTYHHQYNQVKKLIRPFIDENDNLMEIESIQNKLLNYRNKIVKDDQYENVGGKYLARNTVLNKNGFVNISPSNGSEDGSNAVKIEKCMFSIENLAWKDVPKFTKENYISKEQTGPNGGRIMWFPPYNLSFNENVDANWSDNNFIGRGERVYTYVNTDRTGTLSFDLLIDHPSIVNSFAKLKEQEGEDIDADILRFFAGCEIPDLSDKFEPKRKPKIKTPKPKEKPKPTTKRGEIKFYVFFPNNYSGTITDPISRKKNYNLSNDNWWKYILIGNNCSVSDKNGTGSKEWVGYEVTKNQGITKYYEDASVEEEIKSKWIGVSKCWNTYPNKSNCIYKENSKYDYDIYKNDSKIVNRTTGKNCYKYLVDCDLRQVLKFDASYEDGLNCSQQLNTKFSGYLIEKGATCTFGEIVASLIKAKRIINDDFSNELYNFLISNGCFDGMINELARIFEQKDLKIESINILGSADPNDTKNSEMLAYRRAQSILSFLSEIFGEEILDISKNNTVETQKKYKVESSSSPDKKKERYSFVTIEYEYTEIEPVSEMSEQATNTSTVAEDEEDNRKFEEWYDTLIEDASIIQAYKEDFEIDDYEKQYHTFAQEIKEWCTENSVSYDINDYPDSDTWNNNAVKKIVDNYGYKYFIPALCICLYPFNSGFIAELKNKFGDDAYKSLVLSKAELYFEKLFENGYSLEDYIDNQQYVMFNYSDFPYRGYGNEIIISDTGVIYLCFENLVKDYFVIETVEYHISEGIEFAYDYLFNNEYEFNLLKDSIYYKNLITACNNVRQCLLGTYSIICDEVLNNGHITDETILTRFREINDAKTDEEKYNLIQFHQRYILTYFDDAENEILEELDQEAIDGYNLAKSNEERKQKEKDAQKIQKMLNECSTLAKMEEELEDKRAQYEYVMSELTYKDPYTRYETEAEYFQKLEKDDPLVYKSIKDKFKHFDPAFHSISPEGFNARLNFLHQCTRQGHTYEPSEKNGVVTAGNLAFGRMPVCVLRIGDFINTKIIIKNMSINYDNGGMQWDMNPEGIGVQPMYAKINLNITIIGGQSLDGPISRLQNAVSFNYYANTGVYDDRADRYKVNDNGKIVGYDKIFTIKPNKSNENNLLYLTNEEAIVDDSVKEAKKIYDDALNEVNEYKKTHKYCPKK